MRWGRPGSASSLEGNWSLRELNHIVDPPIQECTSPNIEGGSRSSIGLRGEEEDRSCGTRWDSDQARRPGFVKLVAPAGFEPVFQLRSRFRQFSQEVPPDRVEKGATRLKHAARSTYQHGVRLDFTRPGKPMANPFIESFSGGLRDEHLNIELFFLVADARAKLLEWQRDYNEVRPQSRSRPLHVSVRACVAFLQQFFLVMPVCPAPASCRNHGCTRCRIFALHP